MPAPATTRPRRPSSRPGRAGSHPTFRRIAEPSSRSAARRSLACMATIDRPFGRHFEDFEVGDVYRHWPGKTITEYDDHLFCMITMNHHPLHTNEWFARERDGAEAERGGRQPRVLAGARACRVPDVSGSAVANLEVETLKHAKPTFHGDTIYAVTRVLDKETSSKRQAGHRHRRDQGHQPARRGGLLLPPQGDGVEAGVAPARRLPLRRRGRRGASAERSTRLCGRAAARVRRPTPGATSGPGRRTRPRPCRHRRARRHRPGRPGARPGRRHRQADPPAGPHRGRGGGGRAGGRHAGPARRARCPAVEVHDGTAEALPAGRRLGRRGHRGPGLPLVRRPVALAEIAPGAAPRRPPVPGVEHPRRRVDWVRRFGDLLVDGPDAERPYDSTTTSTTPRWWPVGGFAPVQLWTHAWDQPSDPDLLVARAESVSVVGALPPDADRARVLDRIRDLWPAPHPFVLPTTGRRPWCTGCGGPRRAARLGRAAPRRDLPWRATRDPWAVLVSEVMVQQTAVPRVVAALPRLPRALPRPGRLRGGAGRATWCGRGGPRLQPPGRQPAPCAAAVVAASTAARLPADLAALRRCPASGPTPPGRPGLRLRARTSAWSTPTSGRVLARLGGPAAAPGARPRPRPTPLVPAGAAWAWNQAMMELGAHRVPPPPARLRRLPGARRRAPGQRPGWPTRTRPTARRASSGGPVALRGLRPPGPGAAGGGAVRAARCPRRDVPAVHGLARRRRPGRAGGGHAGGRRPGRGGRQAATGSRDGWPRRNRCGQPTRRRP